MTTETNWAADWPVEQDPCGRMDDPITEDWLRENEFRIDSGRRDERLPLRRLAIGSQLWHGKVFLQDSTDLCIDIAPTSTKGQWHVWLMQVEPYRHIHIRHMRYKWEIVRLYEGLTGRCWPGTK